MSPFFTPLRSENELLKRVIYFLEKVKYLVGQVDEGISVIQIKWLREEVNKRLETSGLSHHLILCS